MKGRLSTFSAPTTFMGEAARFTILGSGFGLYGYLPALLELGHRVALPIRYQSVVGGRQELSQFMPRVDWCADVEAALATADSVIVALRPVDQANWIPRLARMPNIRQFVLEKPIAPAPDLAASLLAELECFGKRYRVGYTFRLLPWARQLRLALGEGVEGVSLDWAFLAHHYRNDLASWKRYDSEGGGALRFYGIHLIALLAELGYDDVSASMTWGASDAETQRWKATFTSPSRAPFTVNIDSRASETLFRIVLHEASNGTDQGTDIVVNQQDPFSGERSTSPQGRDIRVAVLERLCRSLSEDDDDHARRQQAIIRLWTRVEERSKRV
jgi:predicted dehydrogenase